MARIRKSSPKKVQRSSRAKAAKMCEAIEQLAPRQNRPRVTFAADTKFPDENDENTAMDILTNKSADEEQSEESWDKGNDHGKEPDASLDDIWSGIKPTGAESPSDTEYCPEGPATSAPAKKNKKTNGKNQSK
jgi:hypothetical protein